VRGFFSEISIFGQAHPKLQPRLRLYAVMAFFPSAVTVRGAEMELPTEADSANEGMASLENSYWTRGVESDQSK
jgi:hypothetical protein